MMSLEVWKAKFGLASGQTQAHPPTDTSTATVPLLAEVDEPADEDVVEVLPPPSVLAPPFPVADWLASTHVSATGNEGSLEASPVAPASGIASGRQGAKLNDQDGKPSTTGEQQTGEPVEQEAAAKMQSTRELSKSAEDLAVDEEGELSAGEESTDSDVVEVPITKPELRRTARARWPPKRLSFHACLPPAAFTAVYDEVDDDLLYDNAEEDEELLELDPDMHADPEHRWDIATMTVKEALASWKEHGRDRCRAGAEPGQGRGRMQGRGRGQGGGRAGARKRQDAGPGQGRGRAEDLECFVAASPHLVSMLLAPEGDPDALDIPTPRSYAEAIQGPYSSQWQAAMDAEMASWKSTGTYVDEVPPPGVNIVSGMWIFRVKRPPGSPPTFKARYVARRFSQRQGVDFIQTFSPTPKMTTLRVLLHVAAQRDYELHSLDFSTAFLQGSLHEEIWLRRPPGFTGSFPAGTQWSLRRPVYGLRQAPQGSASRPSTRSFPWRSTRSSSVLSSSCEAEIYAGAMAAQELCWLTYLLTDLGEAPHSPPVLALDVVLLGAGWKKSQVDEALYFKAGENGVTCWLLVYIDDLLATSSSPAMLKELKELLEAAFELREISPVVKYLGLEIERVEEEYRQKVGSLQFAATTTRPEIAFACIKLKSGLTVRSDQHWHEVDRCLAYLADTCDTALDFGSGPASLELIGYVDAEDAADKQNRTNTGGYMFVYGGGAISWSSSHIKCATLSSTESEYVAATDVGKEGRQLRFLLAEFKLLDAGKPTILRVDNKSAIAIAEGSGLTGNLKHMERCYVWLQHMVRRRKFVLKYIPTTEQPADFLTKGLHFTAFNLCSVTIGQVRLADIGDSDDDVQQ
ncbi:unnamed protein product [Closterium sp. NIES-54]